MMKTYFGLLTTLIFVLNGMLLWSQTTKKVFLSGTGSNHTTEWDFFCTAGKNSGEWTKIQVPSCWEQQGFGSYNYGYDPSSQRADEKGLYKLSFQVPMEWKDKTIHIVFDGSMTDTEVKINGKLAGPIHQGSFYRFKYDITRLIHWGRQNLLEVSVSKISENQSVNEAERTADYWVFGGIFRPVWLEALPQSHLSHIAIDANSLGEFNAKIKMTGVKSRSQLQVQLLDDKGQKMGQPLLYNLDPNETQRVIKTTVHQPRLWSSEFPVLYNAEFSLLHLGKPIHVVSQKFGFRTIEIRQRDGIYLNGTKIKFKGVNRHCFRPETGRTLNKQATIEDVNMIKNMNMNAIRNSHYPADEYFYEVCDSLGIMVLDELAGWHEAYDTPTGTQLVQEMMNVSRNHPCVIMWVNGNEGGHNPDLVKVFTDNDLQKRPVIHAWEIFGGVDTQHYRDYNYGVGNHFQGHEVVFPTEFLHGLYDGGHGAGLEDFWNLMWSNPLSAGGFLWNFADEGILRKDLNDFLDTDKDHGPDGIVGPHLEKEASYFTIKEVWSPVFFEHREITSQFDGTFVVENRYAFTNLNQCKFEWRLAKMPSPFETSCNENEIQGTVVAPPIPPYHKDTLRVILPENWLQYDVLYITAYEPSGREIFTWSWPVSSPQQVTERIVSVHGSEKPSCVETEQAMTVTSNGVSITFDKSTGLLNGIRNHKGIISLTKGPVLCEGHSHILSLTQKVENNNLVIVALFDKGSSFNQVQWTFYPSGWIRLDVEYCPEKELSTLMGFSFSYPEEMITGMQWFGKGPNRVWKNRMKGNQLGVWHKEYNNTITGQPPLIYPEFKGYHSNLYWLKVFTKEQPFTIVCPDEDVFFRMLTPQWPSKPANTNPVFPSGDISFMHGISAIGTKQFTPDRMGPMSHPNIYYTYERNRCKKMTLYFDFRGN